MIDSRDVLETLHKDRREATEKITDHIKKKHYIYTTRHDERPEIWIYHEGIYTPDGKSHIKETCREILGKAYTTQLAGEVISKIEADTYINPEDFFTPPKPERICCQNGIIDLKNSRLDEWNPHEIHFNKIPVKYDPNKDCPNIKKHLSTVLNKPEDILLLQEMFGYVLYRDYKYHKSFMFEGYGSNGKSKTLELFKNFVGAKNCSSIPLSQLDLNGFMISQLHTKMINLSGEVSNKMIKNTDAFKHITGEDVLTADRKYLNSIDFKNYAKLLFNTNELPDTQDMSDGFFRRWAIIRFPFKFVPEEEYDEEEEGTKKADPDILEKLTTPDELSGLLNWAITGLNRLHMQKDFTYTQTTEDVRQMWLRKSNSFRAFLMDCVEGDYSEFVPKQLLKQNYIDYCNRHRLNPESDKKIKDTITKYFGVVTERKLVDDDRVMCWVGVKMVESSVKGVNPVKGFSTLGIISKWPLGIKKGGTLDTLDISEVSLKTQQLQKESLLTKIDDNGGISFNDLEEGERNVANHLMKVGELYSPDGFQLIRPEK